VLSFKLEQQNLLAGMWQTFDLKKRKSAKLSVMKFAYCLLVISFIIFNYFFGSKELGVNVQLQGS
jgi:hypothetical protein